MARYSKLATEITEIDQTRFKCLTCFDATPSDGRGLRPLYAAAMTWTVHWPGASAGLVCNYVGLVGWRGWLVHKASANWLSGSGHRKCRKGHDAKCRRHACLRGQEGGGTS